MQRAVEERQKSHKVQSTDEENFGVSIYALFKFDSVKIEFEMGCLFLK